MVTQLSEIVTEEPRPCAEEDLHLYYLDEVDEHDFERSYLAGGFSGAILVHSQSYCSLFIDIPDNIDHGTLKTIVESVKTNDVASATVICGKKIVLELNEWTEDQSVAAGVWFEKLLNVLSSLDQPTIRKLKKVDRMKAKIVEAIACSAQASTKGSFEF